MAEGARARTIREGVAVAGAVLSPVAVVAGYALKLPAATAVGVVALVIAAVAGRPLVTYRELLGDVSDRSRRAQIRAWTALKVLGILVHLILLAAIGLLAVAVGSRVGLLDVGTFPAATIRDALGVFTAAIVAGLALIHHLSMRVRLHRSSGRYRTLETYASAGAAVLVAAMAVVVASTSAQLGVLALSPTDAPFLQLAAAVLVGAGVYAARSAPTLGLLMVGEEEYYRGHTHLDRERSVVVPALAATGLLMAFLVAATVLIVGLGDLAGAITADVTLLGLVLIFVVIAVAAGATAAVFWRGGGEETPTYRARPDQVQRRDALVLAASGLGASIPAAIAVLLFTGRPVLGIPTSAALDVAAVAILVGIGPPGVWFDRKIRRERALEERFPDLLRDLAASRRAGLTLEKAVRIASRGDYGALDPEIDRMADQLAWNVSFGEALERFADRVDTPLAQRSLALIQQADRAGGDVAGVLQAAARDAQEIKTLEAERHSSMGIYTAIIYVTFFVFLGVAAALFASFIPEIVNAVEQLGDAGTGFAGIQLEVRTIAEYRMFYLTAALVQALGNGIVAGKVETGHLTSGLKHAAVMVAITLVVFVFLLP